MLFVVIVCCYCLLLFVVVLHYYCCCCCCQCYHCLFGIRILDPISAQIFHVFSFFENSKDNLGHFFLFPRNLILGSSSDENLKAWLANEEIYGADNFQAGFTRPTPIRPFCILHRSASDFFPIFGPGTMCDAWTNLKLPITLWSQLSFIYTSHYSFPHVHNAFPTSKRKTSMVDIKN